MRYSLLSLTIALVGTSCQAQVVQLPTFSQFQVSTTVSVPDRGAARLGGVTTSRSGATRRAVPVLGRLPIAGRGFQNRAFGFGNGTTQSSIHATIIDLDEMDRMVLAEARRKRLSNQGRLVADPIEERARFLSQHVGRNRLNTQLAVGALSGATEPGHGRSTGKNARKFTAKSNSPEPPLILK